MIELARRRMMMGGNPLPYDAEVEYLQANGYQYIDTGILATSATSMECQFAFLDSQCPQFMCMGATLTSNCGFFNLSAGYTAGKLGAYMSADVREGAEIDYDTQYHTYYLSASEQRIDNTITSYTSGQHFGYNSQSGVTRQPINIHLLKRNIDFEATSYGYMTCRLKYVRIMNNGILVRDFIPVRKGNTGYLYDKVSGQLFGNQGTGDFIVGPDYNPFAYQYLTFVPLEDSTFSFAKRGTGNDIEYSIDGGAWTSLASEANTPTVAAGHNIRWRAELVPSTTSGSQGIGTFSASGLYDAMGNTMSLLYGDNYIGQTTLVGTYTFCNLWREDSHIYRADRMVLPAMSLSAACYNIMFYSCTSLVTAPALPATKLANGCYYQMFYGCTNLTVAPELPATTLKAQCYRLMFCYCSRLSYIKCLATNITASNCTYYWLGQVSSTGTFVKTAGMNDWTTGASGIPRDWTVIDDPSTINS